MAQGSGRIPTILLTGFLGAGKTTLLNRLIGHYQSQRTVLLINEFGKVGIDGELLADGNYEKVEINRGSLFCICVRTDFIAEVERIATQIQPELLIIEATGVADTSEMEKMLALPNVKGHIALAACLCVVDCTNFLKLLDILNAPESQVRSADLVLVNKIDLVSQDQVEKVIAAVREISSDVPVIRTSYVDFPLEVLERLAADRMSAPQSGQDARAPMGDDRAPIGDGRPDPVFSLTLEADGIFTLASWEHFQHFLKPTMLRVKGFVNIAGRSYHIDATSAHWSMSQRETTEERQNRLVVIGQQFKPQTIQQHFNEALAHS